MSTKKLPNELTEQELLDLITSGEGVVIPTTPSPLLDSDVTAFCSSFKIVRGYQKVNIPALYKIYRAWSKEPISPRRFKIQLSSYFVISEETVSINHSIVNLLQQNQTYSTKAIPSKKVENFKKFLNEYSVNTGTRMLSVEYLYFLYDNWSYDTGKLATLNWDNFVKMCKLFFKIERTKHKIYLLVNKKDLKPVSKELQTKYTNWSRNRHGTQKKKKSS